MNSIQNIKYKYKYLKYKNKYNNLKYIIGGDPTTTNTYTMTLINTTFEAIHSDSNLKSATHHNLIVKIPSNINVTDSNLGTQLQSAIIKLIKKIVSYTNTPNTNTDNTNLDTKDIFSTNINNILNTRNNIIIQEYINQNIKQLIEKYGYTLNIDVTVETLEIDTNT